MDFNKAKQPIALPLNSENEKLFKQNKGLDPELAVDAPQQQECGKRWCFKKGSRGRKVIRRLGHFIVLGTFFYWLWGPPIKFFHQVHELHDIQFSDFTDLDEIPGIVPDDFLLSTFDSDEQLECDKYAVWSEPKKIEHPCRKGHHHRKPNPPDEPESPLSPDHPEQPDSPHKPDHLREPGHPHKPHHPHKPGHPHKPHHPHRRPHGPKYTSDATFKLPLSDSALLFYSQGPFAFGGIRFYQDDSDSLHSDEVEVTINAKIWDEGALELAKVCSLRRDHGSGLGIWTKPVKHESPEERKNNGLALRISVKFPKHPDALQLEKLQTHLPLFAHFFDASLKVKDLEAFSFFLPIKAKDLSVERGKIRTDNNAIIGNFTATELLILETRNSPIAVNVTLTNDPDKKFDDVEDKHPGFSKLFIKTSNSPIHADVSLFAATKDHYGGKFLVDTFTSNSPLHVRFADAPVNSILHFAGFTSNSPALAFLHPTYQGDFLVKSTLFGPKVEVREGLKDPEGEGRTRTVDVSRAGKEIVGKVYWGSEEESQDSFGHVRLGSTLLSAVLKL